MTPDIDIWRSAKLMVGKYGKDAAIHAAIKADDLLDKGDPNGQAAWLRILKAVEELQRERPEGPMH